MRFTESSLCYLLNAKKDRTTLAMFKPDEAACLLAERFNMIGGIYKQEPIMFNRLASRLAALPT